MKIKENLSEVQIEKQDALYILKYDFDFGKNIPIATKRRLLFLIQTSFNSSNFLKWEEKISPFKRI
jgi:hypothetical protein